MLAGFWSIEQWRRGLVCLSIAVLAYPVCAQDIVVRYEKTSDWGIGYKAEITIYNLTSDTLQGWTLSFESGPSIERVWNANLSRDERAYVLSDVGWNAAVPVNGSVRFGLEGSYQGRFIEPHTAQINGIEMSLLTSRAADEENDLLQAERGATSGNALLKDGTQAFILAVDSEVAWPGTSRLSLRLTSRSLDAIDLRQSRFAFRSDMAYEYATTVFDGPSWGQTNLTSTSTEGGYINAIDFTFGDAPWIVSDLSFGQSLTFEFFVPESSNLTVAESTLRASIPISLDVRFGDAELTLVAPQLPNEEVAHLQPTIEIAGPFSFRRTISLGWGQDTTLTELAYGLYMMTALDLEETAVFRYAAAVEQNITFSPNHKAESIHLRFADPEYFAPLRIITPEVPVRGLPEPILVLTGNASTTFSVPWGRETIHVLPAGEGYTAWSRSMGYNELLYIAPFTEDAPFAFSTERGVESELILSFEAIPDTATATASLRLDVEGLPEDQGAIVSATSELRTYRDTLSNGTDIFFANIATGFYELRAEPIIWQDATYLPKEATVPLIFNVDTQALHQTVSYSPTNPVRDDFAPFVDAAAWPFADMETISDTTGIDKYLLGFIVNEEHHIANPCRATWGGFQALYANQVDANAVGAEAHLIDQVRAIRERGGGVMLSFGGAINVPVAATCDNVDSLAKLYAEIIDTYNIYELDFDVEGIWVADSVSIERRSKALAQLQQGRPAVKIWLTLPVTPSGLNPAAEGVIASALEAEVVLDGINVMTMNYGSANAPDPELLGFYAIQAMDALHDQVHTLYANAGIAKSDEEIWHMLGATPMIGVNDVIAEVFSLDHGREVLAFAQEKQLGRLSMWSINRDFACPNGPEPSIVRPNCSSIAQNAYAFTTVFNVYGNTESEVLPRSIATSTGRIDTHTNSFSLGGSYPNPFNPSALIPYTLPEQTHVRLEVFDTLGRRVSVLVDAVQPAGEYQAWFDGARLASGTYLYRLTAGTFSHTKHMLLLK